jgi:long-chain acyl-CoA synthetase
MERLWHTAYAKGVPSSVHFNDVPLYEAFRRTVSKFGERPALLFQERAISYRELDEMVSRFASALGKLGVRPGDKVSLILPNLVQTVVGIYGTLAAGAVVVLHNPRLDDMLLEFQIKDAGSTVLICLDLLVPRMLNVRKRTNLKSVIACHIRDYLPFVKRQLFALVKSQLHLNIPDEKDVFEFTELIEKHTTSLPRSKPDVDDTAFILYTSATTGKPKGVELSHRNVSSNVQQLKAWFPTFADGTETVVGCLPFFHSFGLTCALNLGILHGYSNILIPLPEPKDILEAIADYSPTYLPVLPNFYNAVVNDPKLAQYELKSLKGCFSGGSALPLQTIKSFERLHRVQICEGYGLTECSPVTHVNPFGGRTQVGSIGLPLPDTDAKIVDVQDVNREITEPGVPGELCVKGPQVMKGYHNLPETTAEALRDDWLVTGDIVTMDKDGYFTIVDRKKDMIAAAGSSVYPRDVEEVLFSHPKIKDVCAVGVPSADGGQCVKACIVLKEDITATSAEIVSFCAKRLQRHQVPAEVQFMDDLPRSPVGKVLRKELKRQHLVQVSLARAKAPK